MFFLTASRLSGSDTDTSLDVYDAHVCSVGVPCFVEAVSVPGLCVTVDACRVAPSPQPSIFGAPSSATFTGIGNAPPPPPVRGLSRAQRLALALRACRAKKHGGRRVRVVCEVRARKRFGPVGRAAGLRVVGGR